MDNHIALGHSEVYGWDVKLTCNDCGKEAQGEYGETVNGEMKDICNECGEKDFPPDDK